MDLYRQEHACPRSELEWVDKDQTTVIYKMISFVVIIIVAVHMLSLLNIICYNIEI